MYSKYDNVVTTIFKDSVNSMGVIRNVSGLTTFLAQWSVNDAMYGVEHAPAGKHCELKDIKLSLTDWTGEGGDQDILNQPVS